MCTHARLAFHPYRRCGRGRVGFHTREEGSERFSTASGPTAQPGGLKSKPQGCSRSWRVWSFSRWVDRGAALPRQQRLSFCHQLVCGDVPFPFQGAGGVVRGAQACSWGGRPSSAFNRRPSRGSREPPCGGRDSSGRAWAPRLGNVDADKGNRQHL